MLYYSLIRRTKAQVRVVPSGLAKGNQPVVITISGASSNSVLLPVG